MSERTWAEIDRSALRHNVRELKRSVDGPALMAVVKSNTYGHGLTAVVRAVRSLKAIAWFAVDSLDEALAVRRAGAVQPVLIMGYVPAARRQEACRQGFSQTVYDEETVRLLARLGSPGRPAKIHLKVESGTSRQGALPEDLPKLAALIRRTPALVLEGVSTHYANIEDAADPAYAMRQLRVFRESLAALEGLGLRPEVRHTAASAAAILYPNTRFDAVRIGLSLYGLWPSPEMARSAGRPDLRPALSWKTTVAQVKRLPKGTPISYGLTERLRRDSVVAVLPVGYWDGFPRALSSVGQALVSGRRAKVLGRVCMNMTVVDVTDCGPVRPGDEAVLIGRQGSEAISAEEIAGLSGTINYEVVTRINPQIRRILS